MSRFEKAGELELRGKAVKLILDPQSKDPVRFFMLRVDVEKLLSGEFSYVNVFKEDES
jgi:hypothetical protein